MKLTQKISLKRKQDMKDMIRSIPDFPKSGIVFRDIFPLLQNCFGEVIDDLSRKIERPHEVDFIAGVESRGFIFAAALAYKLNKGFVPIRKKGKLPPPIQTIKIHMEYGETELEMAHISEEALDVNLRRVVIVDDVIVTGETMKAARSLCNLCGYIPTQEIALIKIGNRYSSKNLKYLFEYYDEV